MPALGTFESSILACFTVCKAAFRSDSRRVGWVHRYQLPTGPFCLVGQLLQKSPPSLHKNLSVQSAFTIASCTSHVLHLQILNCNYMRGMHKNDKPHFHLRRAGPPHRRFWQLRQKLQLRRRQPADHVQRAALRLRRRRALPRRGPHRRQ